MVGANVKARTVEVKNVPSRLLLLGLFFSYGDIGLRAIRVLSLMPYDDHSHAAACHSNGKMYIPAEAHSGNFVSYSTCQTNMPQKHVMC